MGGRFRKEPVYVGNHIPPHFNEVDILIDQLIVTVQENWGTWSATELAAYCLWRLNWIHPLVDRNGQTARPVCYFQLCFRNGQDTGLKTR